MKVLMINGSLVYFASANGTLISFLDRLFFSTSFDKTMKVGAGVVAASGQYWNSIHGREVGETREDAEGLQG